jgi:hypothetical protein
VRWVLTTWYQKLLHVQCKLRSHRSKSVAQCRHFSTCCLQQAALIHFACTFCRHVVCYAALSCSCSQLVRTPTCRPSHPRPSHAQMALRPTPSTQTAPSSTRLHAARWAALHDGSCCVGDTSHVLCKHSVHCLSRAYAVVFWHVC